MNWGSVPDWISAVSTAVALLAAAAAAIAAFRQLRILERQNAERQDQDRQADAAAVALWVRVGAEDLLPVIRYINVSGKPIYELTIWIQTPDRVFSVYRTVAGPAQETRPMRQGSRELREAAERSAYHPDWLTLLNERRLQCASRFRDSANRWWLRDFDGKLCGGTAGFDGYDRLQPADLLSDEDAETALRTT